MSTNPSLRNKALAVIRDDSLSGHEIARQTGVHQGRIARIRKGQIELDNVSLAAAEALADYYDRLNAKKPSDD